VVFSEDGDRRPLAAEETLRYHGRTFHLASRVLPAQIRSRAARLYAFCRYVDDLADAEHDLVHAARELARLRDDLVRTTPRSAQSADFLALAADIGLPVAPAIDLIDTVSSDLAGRCLSSEAELVHYAYGVAGTVGQMMCSVLGAEDPRAEAHAVDLGIAMQLTNIARDVGEDAGMGRIYLPASWLGQLEPGDILSPNIRQQAALHQATARCLSLADRYYSSGLAGLCFLPNRCRYSIAVAAQVYRAIGDRVAGAGYRSWDHRAIVPTLARLRIGAGALLRQLVNKAGAYAAPVHRIRVIGSSRGPETEVKENALCPPSQTSIS